MIDLETNHGEWKRIKKAKMKMKKEMHEKMKEDIKMIKSRKELNKEKRETTEIWVEIVGMQKIKKNNVFFKYV